MWNGPRQAPDQRGHLRYGGASNRHAPDVICLTEAYTKTWIQEGHFICCQPDYGYPIKEGRRKVLLWSKEPWEQVDDAGIDSLPPGRFVSGVTRTSVGEVTVIGVCIPAAGMRTEASRGSERKAQWEDHKQYLAGLTHVLERAPAKRLIVVGDFNQRIGQVRYAPPPDVRAALQSAMPPHMTMVQPQLGFQGTQMHRPQSALAGDLTAESLGVISNMDGGTELSDHFGVVADVVRKEHCST